MNRKRKLTIHGERLARNVSFSLSLTFSPNSSLILILYHVIILLINVIAVVVISLFIM